MYTIVLARRRVRARQYVPLNRSSFQMVARIEKLIYLWRGPLG